MATARQSNAKHSPNHVPNNNLFNTYNSNMSLRTMAVSVLQMRELNLTVNKLQGWHLDPDHLNHGLGLRSTSATDTGQWRRVKFASLFQHVSAWSLVTLLL